MGQSTSVNKPANDLQPDTKPRSQETPFLQMLRPNKIAHKSNRKDQCTFKLGGIFACILSVSELYLNRKTIQRIQRP